jgi:hypothetical protein
MALTVTVLGSGVSITSDTTVTATPGAAVAVGDYLILQVGGDNSSTSDADNSEIGSVTDQVLNAWSKLAEYSNGSPGALAGSMSGAWITRVTTALVSATIVTATFAANRTDKACRLIKISGVTAGKVLAQAATAVSTEVNAANGFGSAAFSGLSSAARVYLRLCAKEANSTTSPTPSTNFTAITTVRTRNNAAAQLICGEYRVNTSTGETSNPTLAVSGDTASLFVAFEERDPAVEYQDRSGSAGVAVWRRTPFWADRSQKPQIQGTVEIDWSHPLARGLVFATLAHEGGQIVDLVKPGRVASIDPGNGLWGQSEYGATAIGVFLAGTQADLNFTNKFSLTAAMGINSDNYSEFLRQRAFYTADNDCGGYSLGFAPSSDLGGAGVYLLHRYNNASPGGTVTGGAVTAVSGRTLGRMYRVTGTVDLGTQAVLYVDYGRPGGSVTTNVGAGAAINYSGGNGFQPTGAHSTDSRFGYGYIHARILSADEVIWITQEPFAFLRQVKRRRYRAPVAASTMRDAARGYQAVKRASYF